MAAKRGLEWRPPKITASTGAVTAVASMKLDFSDYDGADPDELNRILWNGIRPGGQDAPTGAQPRTIAGYRFGRLQFASAIQSTV